MRYISSLLMLVLMGCMSAVDSGPDRRLMVQAVLDSTSFAQYARPQVAGRVPLVISDLGIGSDAMTLKAFGQPVRVVNDPALRSSEYFVRFTQIHSRGSLGSLVLELPIEGIQAHVNLERDASGTWRIVKENYQKV